MKVSEYERHVLFVLIYGDLQTNFPINCNVWVSLILITITYWIIFIKSNNVFMAFLF